VGPVGGWSGRGGCMCEDGRGLKWRGGSPRLVRCALEYLYRGEDRVGKMAGVGWVEEGLVNQSRRIGTWFRCIEASIETFAIVN